MYSPIISDTIDENNFGWFYRYVHNATISLSLPLNFLWIWIEKLTAKIPGRRQEDACVWEISIVFCREALGQRNLHIVFLDNASACDMIGCLNIDLIAASKVLSSHCCCIPPSYWRYLSKSNASKPTYLEKLILLLQYKAKLTALLRSLMCYSYTYIRNIQINVWIQSYKRG